MIMTSSDLLRLGFGLAGTALVGGIYFWLRGQRLREWLVQLLEALRDIVREEDARNLSLGELEEVVLEKGYPEHGHLIPAQCPRCDSELDRGGGSAVGRRGDQYAWQEANCTNPDCDWTGTWELP